MKKILTVLGARPQFIKASVVSHNIAILPDMKEVLVHTGQHFDANMSDVFFAELGINKPDYCLDIHGGTHGSMTGRMLEAVENVLIKEKPDVVLVYGDTNSTLAGALAASKLRIPVAHVEAGLRSFNMAMPEEINRIITDRISQWLFTPTKTATANLLREGHCLSEITEVGDVMYDVALFHGERIKPYTGLMLDLGLTQGNYILATIHRQENTDDPARLAVIVDSLVAASRSLPVVWPVHPRTLAVLQKSGKIDLLVNNVMVIDPIGYLNMVQLEKFAALIATDSGGVQKEAFFYKVPCVTLRDETEWGELVESGWNRLVSPTDLETVQRSIFEALGSCGKDIQPYGDGNAARRLVQVLKHINS